MKNVFLDTNVIVTNNGRDFAEFSDLPFMSAADFLRQLS